MSFWKNIFKQNEKDVTENHFLNQKGRFNGYYANSWVNNEIPELEATITELIYQKELDVKIVNHFLNFGSNNGKTGWSVKGELNFPGPFYTGETDTCGTGIIECPNNVIFDEDCMEHVMIQPRNKVELLQLGNAAAVEVFCGYYCDGNKHWTVQLARNWWSNRYDILEHLKNDKLAETNCNQEKRYKHYLESSAEMDLRRYCFFLENGFYPTDQKLPELSK